MKIVRGTRVLHAGLILMCWLAQANALDTPSPKPAQKAVVQALYDTKPTSNHLFKDKSSSQEPPLIYDDSDLDLDLDSETFPEVQEDDVVPTRVVPEAVAIKKPTIHKHASDSNFLVSRVSTILESIIGNVTRHSDHNESLPHPHPLLLPTKKPNAQKTAEMPQLPALPTPSAPDDLKPRFHRKPQRRSNANQAHLRELPVPVKRVPFVRGDSEKARMLPHKTRRIPHHADAQ
jgi:hypothetical protein